MKDSNYTTMTATTTATPMAANDRRQRRTASSTISTTTKTTITYKGHERIKMRQQLRKPSSLTTVDGDDASNGPSQWRIAVCLRPQNRVSPSSVSTSRRHSRRVCGRLWALLVVLACAASTAVSPTAAAPQLRPVAAPLLGNAAAPSLLNATTAVRAIETNSIQRAGNSPLSGAASAGGTGGSVAGGGSTVGGGGGDHSRSLKRVFLSNRTITCNDGSHAGFYLRKNPNSKKWIVFLEGGWHCYDTRSCRARWLRLRHLMTSAQWPETRDVGGILSPLKDENPYWHNANHVLVPYCSSDSWSGTRAVGEARENNWRFMGALILRQVIADLVPLGLGRAVGAELLLVGSSAGGLGVMLNLDRVTNYLLHERKLEVTVRGVSDSGWFLDREPYTPAAVASSEAVRQGWKLWQGLLPDDCVSQHPAEPWRCYFGYRLYPTLKSSLFVFQWLFDEAQMRADNVGAPVTPQQWNYIHEMGGALRSSLDNVTAVFAPSCIGHAVLSKRDWVNIKIDDISLPAALRCWEHSTRPRRKRHDKLKRPDAETPDKRRHQNGQQRHNGQKHKRERERERERQRQRKANDADHPKRNQKGRQRITKAERQRRRHEKRQRRRENRRQRNRRKNAALGTAAAPISPDGAAAQKQHESDNNNNSSNNNNNQNALKPRQGNKRRRMEEALRKEWKRAREPQYQQEQPAATASATPAAGAATSGERPSKRRASNNAVNGGAGRVPRVPEKCALRLLERCSWPQCNHSCPTLTNPLTGEEMRFLELLTSFGLDIEAVAAALGVDMHTLNNMDRTELVNLLTQQVS